MKQALENNSLKNASRKMLTCASLVAYQVFLRARASRPLRFSYGSCFHLLHDTSPSEAQPWLVPRGDSVTFVFSKSLKTAFSRAEFLHISFHFRLFIS